MNFGVFSVQLKILLQKNACIVTLYFLLNKDYACIVTVLNLKKGLWRLDWQYYKHMYRQTQNENHKQKCQQHAKKKGDKITGFVGDNSKKRREIITATK